MIASSNIYHTYISVYIQLNQTSKSMKTLTLIAIFVLIFCAKTQVLGIDFGTQFWKAALISPGKNLVIVENSRSERKTLNSIAFHEGVRFFQDDSKSKRLKKPQLSYFYLNKLIRSLDTEQKIPGYKFEGDTYVFDDGDKSMTLQQVVGMILRNIKQLASHQAGTDIRDVVLSVPSNWGFHAKMSLVNAAYLAEFSVLGLINQNSAAAIQFAISRNDTDPLNIILFNYGSHNLQLSVIKAFGYFSEQKNKTIQSIEALAHSTIQNVGGLRVDEQIAKYLAEQFTKKNKVDPLKNKKSYTKLLVKSAQIKQTLSANRQTQVYIQGLIDGIDLNLPISRQVIEDCEHFKQFSQYLDDVIAKAGLTKEQIHSIQMIGGASRIPRVGSTIKQYFSSHQAVEVGSHINGDQAVAFGSALRAANLSLTFRVKQLHFYDPMNLDTKVVITSPDKGVILQETLFHLSDHHGAKKSLSLNHNDQDIKITVYVGDQIVKQFATKNIPEWKKKHQNENITGQPNIVIEFMMSSVHIADVKDLYLNLTINVTSVKEKVQYVEEQVQQVIPESKKQEEQSDKKEQEQKQQSGEQKTQEKQGQAQKQSEKLQSEQKKEGDQQKEQQSEKKKTRKVNKTKTIKKLVQEHQIRSKKHSPSIDQTFSKYKRFSKDQIDQKRKLLQQYESFEKALKDKAKIRNDFESALYGLKDNFEEQYLKTFSKQKQLAKLIETVTTELQWLEENAWTATKQNFEQHFKILSDVYGPIYNRTNEYRGRQKAYNQTMGYLGMVYQRTNDLLNSHPWIKEKVESHLKKVNQTAQWISRKLKKQMDRELNQNPVIYNHEMIQKAEQLRNEYYILKMTPRPKMNDILKNMDLKDFMKKMEQEQKKKKEAEQNNEKSQENTEENENSQQQTEQNNEEQTQDNEQNKEQQKATAQDL